MESESESESIRVISIMDFLRGQYVIYRPVRIILKEDEVRGQYTLCTPNRSIYSILTQLKVLKFYLLHNGFI